MKPLVCDICGGKLVMGAGGIAVCESCGMEYSPERMKEKVQEVRGTVKIDTSDRVKNLYQLARRAKAEENYENAAKYYSDIAVEAPDDWEAAFYSVYCKAMCCRIIMISSAANSISNCLNSVMLLIKNNLSGEEQKKAYTEVALTAVVGGASLLDGAKNFYMNNKNYDNAASDFADRATAAFTTVAGAGLMVVQTFDDALLAKEIYDHGIKMCENFAMTKQYAQVFRNQLKEIEPQIKEQKWALAEEYWNIHEDEKNELLRKKQELQDQIRQLEDNRKNIHMMDDEEKRLLQKNAADLALKKNALGAFKSREKKEINRQIEENRSKVKENSDKRDSEIREIDAKIAAVNKKIEKIDWQLLNP